MTSFGHSSEKLSHLSARAFSADSEPKKEPGCGHERAARFTSSLTLDTRSHVEGSQFGPFIAFRGKHHGRATCLFPALLNSELSNSAEKFLKGAIYE